MKRIAPWALLALMLGSSWAQAATITVGGGGDHATIQAAIDAALAGDTILIADGTYPEALSLTKPLSLVGNSRTGVIIDASAFDSYSIGAQGDHAFVFSDFTLIGNPTFATAFGLKIAGDGATCDVRRVTIQDCYRTGLDLNGLDGGVVEDCTVTGTVFGVGLGMTNCSNIAVTNLSTGTNGWAGVAIYADGSAYTGGSDGVSFSGTLILGEPVPLYTEETDGFAVTNLQVSVAALGALTGNNLDPTKVAYMPTVAIAQAGVLATDALNGWVINRATGAYAVTVGMSIQAAIDAASPGDVVNVGAGIHREQLFIDKELTLGGNVAGTTRVEAPDAVDRSTYDITTWTGGTRTVDAVIGVLGADVDLHHLVVDGRNTGPDNFYGVYYHDAGGSVTFCTVTNITHPAGPGAQRVVSMAFSNSAATGPFTVDVSDNVIPTFQKGGILVMGPAMVFTVERNQVTAYPTPDIAGNGIQLSYGATGTTLENTVSGVGYTGSGWSGSGILLFESGDVTMTGDTVTGSQTGISYSDWRWVYSHPVPVNIALHDLTLTGNEWSLGAHLAGDQSDLNLVMDGCAITGSTGDAIDIYGDGPYTGYYTGWDNGDLDVVITDLTIDNTAIDGIWTADFSGNATNTVQRFSVTGSSFTNTVGGAVANTFATATIDAPQNYWGDPAGPTVGAKAMADKAVAPLAAPAGFDLPKNGRTLEAAATAADKAAETVTGLVDFSPWYGLPLGTSPMIIGTNDVIGDAIDLALAGDSINVDAGHYEEQVHIATDNLTITGAGVGATFVDAPVDMPLFFTSSADNYPIVFVDGASGTTLSGLTIDGQGNGAANYRFCGLGLNNADGTYSDLHVTRVRNEPLDGSQHGNGLYVINADAATRTVAFTDVVLDDIQKNATVFAGAGLTVDALRLTCSGNGPLGVGLPAQNGIQVSGGTIANLTDCVIADYDYTDPAWTATGLLFFDGGTVVNVSGGSVDACRTSIYFVDASGTVDGITVTNPQGDPMYAYSTAAKAAGGGRVQPQGFDVVPGGNANKAAVAVTLTNSTFIGNDVVDSWGPSAYAVGPVDFTVEGCTIEHFDWGLVLYEAGSPVTGSATGNALRDNVSFGAWSNTVVPYDARGNDWGDLSGPYHPTLNAAGLGNEVSDNILFEPWTGMAGLGVVPSESGPMACGRPLALTFQYTADELTPDLFLYNIVVRVTPELFFNTVANEFPFGQTNQNFFVVDNLDGTWTFTGSTVANPSSPVMGPGTFDLFTIQFTTAAEGTGEVTFESFALRDPDNASILAVATGATAIIDCTAPAAVTGITATTGHNKIDVDWSHDGVGVDHYEVFVGLWHNGSGASAYPEYDDLPNDVIPGRPLNYTAAVALPAWVDLPAVAAGVTNLTQTWPDDANRGVYYYEVFAVDDVGNGSPRAAANDRATNYWLGDVYGDVANDYTGNGLVNFRDVNYLAASFGDPVTLGSPEGVLDVGPTDDMSRLGIPQTDNWLNFEDLMVFSMNFGVVSPAKGMAPVSDRAVLAWVDYGDGRYGLRLVEGPSLKGLRITAGAEVTGVEAGTLLDEQGEPTFLRNLGAGLDASVAVMGVDNAFAGTGDLLIVSAKDAIDASDLVIDARATDNSKLEVSLEMASGTLTPRVFALHPNYPNPFNPMTKISFSLPEAQPVRLTVYTVDGRKVATLVNEVRGPGLHEVIWNGRDDTGRQSASGVYFCRVEAGPYSQVRKMTLMK